MINATDIRKGMVLRVDRELFVVLDREHVTPGNLRAKVQVDMRSLRTGTKTPKRFRADEQVEEVFVETKTFEYLYPEADTFVFMDVGSYEQIPVQKEVVGDLVRFMPLNCQVKGMEIEGKIVSVELPTSVVLEVTDCEPGVKGDSRTNITKNATVSTGFAVKVPLFIRTGEKIKIDTRTGEFVERVNG